jgi:ankyrin repeat protein
VASAGGARAPPVVVSADRINGETLMRVKAKGLLGVFGLLLATGMAAASPPDGSLADAVKRQDRAAVSRLLKTADVNGRLADGATALHWAAHWDDVDTVDALIRLGARVDAATEYGVTPLVLAATNGSAAAMATLIRAGANPNTSLPTGETPLIMAARTGKAEAVTVLLERSVEINAVDSRGQTALMWAAGEGYPAVVDLLIKRGADVSARSKSGFSAFLISAKNGDIETSRLLLAAGADVNEAQPNGTTALVLAAAEDHDTYAAYLLEHGADPNKGPGYTPLHLAAAPPAREGEGGRETLAKEGEITKLELIKRLLARGADPNMRAARPPRGLGSAGATPFFLAAWAADAEVMRLLLTHGANPRLANKDNTTALMAAAGVGRVPSAATPERHALEAVKLCVELGLDVNAANANGETPLHGAAYRGIEGGASIVEFLVGSGAKINVKNKRNWTPLLIAEGLYFAADNTLNPPVVKALQQLGADPSPRDYDRNTGLRTGEQWYLVGTEPSQVGINRPATQR